MRKLMTVTDGSGIGSGKSCVIIDWKHQLTKQLRQEYPFVGGRTPQSMGWVAVQFEDGSLGTYPKNRVTPRKESL